MTQQVWKTEKTEYYAILTKRHGTRACARRVSYWTAVINGQPVRGFVTKKQALAAIAEAQR